MTQRNILVTGASGTVGFEVLKQLLEKRSYHITVFDKKTKLLVEKLRAYKDKVQLIFGDITNPFDVAKIPNIDAVIHLATIIPPLADKNPELAEKVNTQGTQNLIHHLEKTSPNAFFMYSSSISVYGDRVEHPFIKVGDSLMPSENDVFAETKIAAEESVQKSQLDWTIFRLAAIMGNHKISKLMFRQPLNTALEFCTPRDMARAFVNAIDKQPELSEKIFNLGGGERCRIRYKHFLERSFTIFGLGALDFPKFAFADKNFHFGFYADGHDLENILHFRQDSLDDYFAMEASKVSSFQKTAASTFNKPIKWVLLKMSEPYRAFRTQDAKQLHYYFNLNSQS
ncbi:MAG: NAD(P)-dependent oxidoreductase [Gelidibacter sp.]